MKKIKMLDNPNALMDLKQALTYVDGSSKYSLTDEEIKIIEEIYTSYHDTRGLPNETFKSINLTNETNNAIYDGYDEVQENRRLKDLRSKILLLVKRCPYCGILPADELDHHLPRSIYKALAVFSSNLVPICHKCNNKKRTASGLSENERFIHLYFDDLPDVPILVADVQFKDKALIVNFRIEDAHLSEPLASQLKFQFSRINLVERLKPECNIYLFTLQASLEDVFNSGEGQAVKILLKKQTEYNRKKFGHNDWRTALLKALSECDEFCDGGLINYFENLE